MRKLIVLMLFLISIVSCSSTNINESSVKFEDAKKYKFLTISAQPNKEVIDKVKENGFDIILNLRGPKEFTEFNEEKYTKAHGLNYANIPFLDQYGKIQEKNVKKITSFIEKNRDKKIFVHCSSGNRVSAWLLIHLHQDHNMPLEEALKITAETGLTKNDLRENTLKFMKVTK